MPVNVGKILYVYVTHRAVFAPVWRRVTADMARANCSDYLFICGLHKTEWRAEQRTLFLNCNDHYEGLPEKMIAAFHFLEGSSEFAQYEYFVKLDADLFLAQQLDYNTLRRARINYGGVLGYGTDRRLLLGRCSAESHFNYHAYTGPADVYYCLGGYGYVLSRRALAAIKKDSARQDIPYEDLYVGFLMRKHGITPVAFPMWQHAYSVGVG